MCLVYLYFLQSMLQVLSLGHHSNARIVLCLSCLVVEINFLTSNLRELLRVMLLSSYCRGTLYKWSICLSDESWQTCKFSLVPHLLKTWEIFLFIIFIWANDACLFQGPSADMTSGLAPTIPNGERLPGTFPCICCLPSLFQIRLSINFYLCFVRT